MDFGKEARMRIIVDASGNVLMWSAVGQPTPDVGQTAVDLSPDQEASFVKACAAAPNGVTFDGQTFTPIPSPPPPIPQQVTPLQIRHALRQLGLLDQVNAYVSTQSGDVQDAWQFAVAISRNDPMVVAAATALGVDADALFRLAGTFT
jgi:hypothetical protein